MIVISILQFVILVLVTRKVRTKKTMMHYHFVICGTPVTTHTLNVIVNSAAAILKKSLISGDTPTRGITRYHICNLKQKNVYFLESVVVVK